MKLLVISDSHDNIVRLRHTIGFGEASGMGAIIHCGDWNTPLAVKEFSRVKIPVYGVLGNADIDPRMQTSLQEANIQFNLDFLKLSLDNRTIGICHYPPSSAVPPQGKPCSVSKMNEALSSREYDLIVHGHTHQRGLWKHDNTLLVNPGALHRTLKPSFAVYDTELNEVEFVDVAA